jgi:diguanylate cyclase (GGDEF)-like protein
MPLLGIIVQILFKDVLLIWGSVSISLLLYYIFLRELYFKYDVQTEMRNRSAFEKEMSQHLKGNKNVVIVVVDINNLKDINDGYGHQAGDETIYHAAKIIHESFRCVGKAYRIGGDEFCIICEESSKELIDSTLSNMECLLAMENQKHNIDIALAYGYAFYHKNNDENIYSIFAKADEVMYIHKAKLKNAHAIKAR